MEAWGTQVNRTVKISVARETVIHDLPPSRYLLRATDLGETCHGVSNAVVDLADVTDSKPVPVKVVPGGAIRGLLSDVVNSTQVAVVLVATDQAEEAQPVQIVLPDAERRFTFGGLRPGRYRIAARPSADPSKGRWIHDLGRMFELEVPGGSVTDIELPVSSEDN
jgi:hypothetical protein